MNTNVIECINMTLNYDTRIALDKVTCSIERDKIVGLIGRNGAGKTSFMKLCAGYRKSKSGQLKVFDQDPFDNLKLLQRLIFIGEDTRYDSSLTLRDILRIYSLHYYNWDKELENKLMKDFDLQDKFKYNGLSRGMKTAFNFTVALSSRADITLMDEPTTGLDSASRKEFYNVMINHYMEFPRTILISSHLVDEVENMLEEIVLFDKGSVVLHQPLEDLQQYGIYLNGKKDILEPFIKDKQVLHIESLGNSLIAAVKNDLTQNDFEYIAKHDIDISKIRVNEVCNYLTEHQGGEISVQ